MAINLTRALCGRSLGLSLRNQAIVPSVRCVTIKIVQAPPPCTKGYDQRNMDLGREMSPHLLIYKPQLTSMLSISHRITGMMLTGYAGIIGVGALVLPHDLASCITVIEGLHLEAPAIGVLKFMIAFPATFHTVNGIRHLCWDNGLFLSLKEVYSTGWAMLVVATLAAGGLAAM